MHELRGESRKPLFIETRINACNPTWSMCLSSDRILDAQTHQVRLEFQGLWWSNVIWCYPIQWQGASFTVYLFHFYSILPFLTPPSTFYISLSNHTSLTPYLILGNFILLVFQLLRYTFRNAHHFLCLDAVIERITIIIIPTIFAIIFKKISYNYIIPTNKQKKQK